MVTASASWTDGERFVGVASSGHAIVVDAAKDKTGPSPMELVLIGLCGCTASDVVGILRKKREPFTRLEVSAEAERAPQPPAVYTSMSGYVSSSSATRVWRVTTAPSAYCSTFTRRVFHRFQANSAIAASTR